MNSGNKRNLQLDVLRGVAILLVIGRHLDLRRSDGILGTLAEGWYRIGWLGVDLFFVLSGFLIGGLLLMELDKHGTIDVPRFLIRRGLKIYPMYFVFVVYVMLMPVAKTWLRGGDVLTTLSINWENLWPNLLFLQNYIGKNPIGHSWSLAVEEHFYLMLPFVLVAIAAAKRTKLLFPLCLSTLGVCLLLRCLSVWTDDPFARSMSATHLRIDALLAGVAIRGIAQFKSDFFGAARKWAGPFVLAGFLFWLPNLFIDPSTGLIKTVGLTGTLLGSAAFLTAICHIHARDFGRTSAFVSPIASLVAWIGVYSYGIYLWHVTAIGILEREVGGRILTWAGSLTPLAWLATLAVLCGGAIFAGVIASKIVEWPVLRLRDRIFPSRSGSLPSAYMKSQGEKAPAAAMPAVLDQKAVSSGGNNSE